MTTAPAWLYHHAHPARIFETDAAVAEAIADGWVDSPDKAKPRTRRAASVPPVDTEDGA